MEFFAEVFVYDERFVIGDGHRFSLALISVEVRDNAPWSTGFVRKDTMAARIWV
jgi:hypothetical protein